MATKRTIAEIMEESASGVKKATTPIAETAAAAGQAAAPSTPLGTAGLLGATPQQAAMAGTPNQLASAVDASVSINRRAEPAKPAAQTVDKGGMGGATAPSEAAAQRKVEQDRLATAYGDVGLRVDALITSAIPAPGSTPATPKFTVDTSTLAGLADKGAAAQNVTTTLQALAENPSDPARFAAALSSLSDAGYPNVDPTTLLDQEDASVSAANAAANRITLTPEVLEQLGIQDGELELLGIDESDLAGMTLATFQDRLDAKLAEEEDALAQQRREASDPNSTTGLAREAAEAELTEAGAAGVTAAAAQTDDLRDKVAEGSSISINGREISLDDFLSDEELPGLIKQYLDNPDGRKELDDQLGPEFGEFVRNHADFLTSALAEVTATAATTNEALEGNAAVLTAVDLALPDDASKKAFRDAMKLVFPNIEDKFSLDKLDPTKSGVLALLSGRDALPEGVTPAAVVEALSEIAKLDPALAKELFELSPKELVQADVLFSPSRRSAWVAAVRERQAFDADPAAFMAKLLGTNAKDEWSKAQALAATGDDKQLRRWKPLLDADGDGKLDSWAQIQENVSKHINSPSVSGLMGGAKSRSVGPIAAEAAKPAAGSLAEKLIPFLGDGGIGAKDVKALAGKLTAEEMLTLANSPSISASGSKALGPILDAQVRKETVGILANELNRAGVGNSPVFNALESGVLPKFGGGARDEDLAKFVDVLRAAIASNSQLISSSFARSLLDQVVAEQTRRVNEKGKKKEEKKAKNSKPTGAGQVNIDTSGETGPTYIGDINNTSVDPNSVSGPSGPTQAGNTGLYLP